MSHTIRNEVTKGFLDKLAQRRKKQKQIRDEKAQTLLYDYDLEFQIEN